MSVSVCVQVRRIFTVRQPLQDTSPDCEEYCDLELEGHLHDVAEVPRAVDCMMQLIACCMLTACCSFFHCSPAETHATLTCAHSYHMDACVRAGRQAGSQANGRQTDDQTDRWTETDTLTD